MKCRRVVRITKTPGDYDGCRKNPDSSPGIYMNVVMEDQCCIVAENWRNKYEAKRNEVQVNATKKAACITNRGSFFENILSIVANLRSDTETTKNSTDSILQASPPIF